MWMMEGQGIKYKLHIKTSNKKQPVVTIMSIRNNYKQYIVATKDKQQINYSDKHDETTNGKQQINMYKKEQMVNDVNDGR